MGNGKSANAARLKPSRRQDREGWIYASVAGTAGERGYQHGYRLAAEIREALASIRYLLEHDTKLPFDWFARNAEAMFRPTLERFKGQPGSGGEILEELNGIVEGANAQNAGAAGDVTLVDLIGWNAYPEMICQWFPAVMSGAVKPLVPIPATNDVDADAAKTMGTERRGLVGPRPASKPKHWPRRPSDAAHSCSAFVAVGGATADGGVVIGHTTWQSFANGDAYNVILDVTPDAGHRVLMQSVPGYVHSSTDFCLTGAGLAVAETSLNVGGFDVTGLPEFFRSRRACQYADTIADWRQLFREGNNGGYVNTWLLADARRHQVAAYELTLGHDVLSDVKADGYYASCNIPQSPEVRKFGAAGSEYDNLLKSGARRVRFDQLMAAHRGRVDEAVAQAILSDHLDVYQGLQNPCGRTICGHLDNDAQRSNFPWGSLDGKVATGPMIEEMTIAARWGRACGTPFDADAFHLAHPQYDWLKGRMKSRPTRPWTAFPA